MRATGLHLYPSHMQWVRKLQCRADRVVFCTDSDSMLACMQAVRTGLNAKAQGDTGRVMVVLLTDGRANVSLAKSNEDPDALAEGAPKATKVCLHASWELQC